MGPAKVGMYDGSQTKIFEDTQRKRSARGWGSHYQHTHTHPVVANIRYPLDNKLPIAGMNSSPFQTSFDVNAWEKQIPDLSRTQKEYFGSTLSLDHAGCQLKPDYSSTTRSSYNRPVIDGPYKQKPDMDVYTGIEVDRLMPPKIATNNRNAWVRNASNVGPLVFKQRPKQSKPTQTEGVRNSGQFKTSRQEDDRKILLAAYKTNAYNNPAVTEHYGYSIKNKRMDDTTISAETPAWMQIPLVNVSPLSRTQVASPTHRQLGMAQWLWVIFGRFCPNMIRCDQNMIKFGHLFSLLL